MAAFWPIGTAQIIHIFSYPVRKRSRFWLFRMWFVKGLYHALLPKTDYSDKGRGNDFGVAFSLLISWAKLPFMSAWQTRVHFCSNVILPWKLRCLCLCCLVPVRHLSRPSRSMHFSDLSETNGRETPRQSRSAHVWAFLHFLKVPTFNWNNL